MRQFQFEIRDLFGCSDKPFSCDVEIRYADQMTVMPIEIQVCTQHYLIFIIIWYWFWYWYHWYTLLWRCSLVGTIRSSGGSLHQLNQSNILLPTIYRTYISPALVYVYKYIRCRHAINIILYLRPLNKIYLIISRNLLSCEHWWWVRFGSVWLATYLLQYYTLSAVLNFP